MTCFTRILLVVLLIGCLVPGRLMAQNTSTDSSRTAALQGSFGFYGTVTGSMSLLGFQRLSDLLIGLRVRYLSGLRKGTAKAAADRPPQWRPRQLSITLLLGRGPLP